eukprot:TRINITY_DN4230_c0_g1_i5.p1 TRINITY_DN4230_c0_g1~~TRINITY_DN4230_c0_g1_i5.p1  ORF type:complete len:222 (+),score=58.49 TRINITY_DN4230_c0_g1_i5:135-800(+)
MRVYVVSLLGDALALEVEAEHSVGTLKKAVAEAVKINPTMQRVCLRGTPLPDRMTLRKCAGAANVLVLDVAPKSVHVVVRTPAGAFDVDARTMRELRECIQQRTGINAARQRLFVGHEELTETSASLTSLRPGATVEVKEVSVRGMFVLIETLAHKVIEISCSEDDTVLAIKGKTERTEGVPVDQQRLIVNRRQLEDSATLREYGITEGTRLWLVYRLRGS